MTRSRICIILLVLLLLGGLASPAHAQASIQVVNDAVSLSFPDTIDFQAEFQATAISPPLVLEYGTTQLTCGTVEAKAFPTFTPARM